MNDVILSAQDAVQAVGTNADLKTISHDLSTLDPGLGVGIVTGKTAEGMTRQPEMTGQLHTTIFLGIAFTGALALVGLVVGLVFV